MEDGVLEAAQWFLAQCLSEARDEACAGLGSSVFVVTIFWLSLVHDWYGCFQKKKQFRFLVKYNIINIVGSFIIIIPLFHWVCQAMAKN